MRSPRFVIVLTLALAPGCHAGRRTPAAPPAASPAPVEAATLELPRIVGSASGEAIVAWEGGVPVEHRSHLCVLRVAERSVRCTIPAAVASDIPGGFTIAGVSPSLRYLAVRLVDELRIYETAALRVVASVPLGDGEVGPVDFDPDETRAVWMQASTPWIATLASGEVSASPALPDVGANSRVRWLPGARLLVWSTDRPPVIVGGDGSHELVKLPPTSWAGARVDVRGARVGIATSSGLVAVFAAARADQVQILRAPTDDASAVLHSVTLDPAGRRVLTVRAVGHSTEVGLFDTAGEPPRLLSTPGDPMFADFSGDGAAVAWSSEDMAGDMMGGALFPSFTTRVDLPGDVAHSLDGTFLEWSGSRMLVYAEGDACLRERGRSLFCRDQSWAPYPETHRAGEVVWVGGDHILRADPRERRVSELYVTGTVDRPVLKVIEHSIEPADPNSDSVGVVQGATSQSAEVPADHR